MTRSRTSVNRTFRTIKLGVGIIAAGDVNLKNIAYDELRRGEAIVYRLLDAAGECIYIGFTESPLNRWQAHLSGKPWRAEIAAIYYVAGLSKRDAIRLERDEISADRPKYNRMVKRS